MSLFQCENCGCRENTSLASQGFEYMTEYFDWSYAPEREGMLLCSACGPSKYKGGQKTEYGEWHGQFDRVFLPKGEFKTNGCGNLEHIESGSEDVLAFAIEPLQQPDNN